MATTHEYSFTDLLRRPKEVVAAADQAAILVRRRGAPDLVLRRADHHSSDSDDLGSVADLLGVLLTHVDEAMVGEFLVEALPWTEYLSIEGRDRFVDELRRSMTAATDLHTVGPVTQCLHEWKATAAIQADPALTSRLTRPLATPLADPVPTP